MTATRHSRLLHVTGLLLCTLVWLANNSNPPTGRTGAPFDGHCNDCHSGGNFNGNVTIDGLPGTIEPDVTYPITLTMEVTSGSPSKGGFQIVAVDGNNVNAGDLMNIAGQGTGTENFGGREYLEHRFGKNFSAGMASWNFNWKSPTGGVNGNTIQFYFIGNFTNGNGQNSGDFPIAFSQAFDFSAPPPVTATITNSTDVSCFGGNDGTATVEGGGGTPPYTYLWSNGQTTETAVNLTANNYTVTVTGSGGSGTASVSVAINQPTSIIVTATVDGVLTCTNTSVTATASASGGTPGYEFNWSDGQFGNPVEVENPGQYVVTATDANGCTKIAIVNVLQNIATPTAVVSGGGILDCNTTELNLNGVGSSQGSAFSYLWTTFDGNIVSGETTLIPLVNAAGTYTLTVTNIANGCTASAEATVSADTASPDVSVSNTGPLTCTIMSVTLIGNSATPDVSYMWTGPDGFSSADQNPTTDTIGDYTLVVENPVNGCTSAAITTVNQNTVPPTDTARVSGILTCAVDSVELSMATNIQTASYKWTGPNGFISTQQVDTIAAPGDYVGIVTDTINGCKTQDTITVEQNITVPGASAAASGPITCANTSVQLTGGPSGQNTFSWIGPNNFSSSEQNPTVDTAGLYTLTVLSGINACTSSASVTVQQNLIPPVASIAPPANLNCNNATLQLNASGSSQGANFTYLWTTGDGVIESGETSLTPIVSTPGTYNLLVTNTNNGCTTTAATTVMQSPPVVASISASSNVSCNGGSDGAATAAGSGGNDVFSYLWSTGSSTATISNLASGTYTVTITDGENCSATATVTITQPIPLVANATSTSETALGANDGTATASPTGGTPAYTYIWSTGGSTASIMGLMPGTYTVTVMDANGCTVAKSVTVNAFGCNIAGDVNTTNVTCNSSSDGTATVTLMGAVDPVSFTWSNGDTTALVTGLQAGMYTVSIIDGSNCPLVLEASVTQPMPVLANASATGETASGANNGTAMANPSGGTGPYSYAWSTSETTAAITGLMPGAYTVSVTDANNCSAVQTVNVSAFNCIVTILITGADATCFGANNGLATAVLSGGQLPYSYFWSNGASTATANNLVAGAYTVTATDAAGCIVADSIVISEPTMLMAQASNIQHVLCLSDLTGSADIMASGGTSPYSLSGDLTDLGVGTYTIIVTDENNCSTSASFDIVATDNALPVVSCPATIFLCGADIVNYPAPTATDNCGALPGPPVLISGQVSGTAFDDGTTLQVFQATDALGNSATCSFAVTVYPIPDIMIDGVMDDHNGEGIGTISVTPLGGGGSFVYTWNKDGQFFSNDEDLTGLSAGSYSLTISDANGCTSALAPIMINNTVGTYVPGESGSIRLYPNPASRTFQLEINELDVIAATIFDTRGKIVSVLQAGAWESEVSVDQLSTGLYFLRLSTHSGRVLTLKFIKSE